MQHKIPLFKQHHKITKDQWLTNTLEAMLKAYRKRHPKPKRIVELIRNVVVNLGRTDKAVKEFWKLKACVAAEHSQWYCEYEIVMSDVVWILHSIYWYLFEIKKKLVMYPVANRCVYEFQKLFRSYWYSYVHLRCINKFVKFHNKC